MFNFVQNNQTAIKVILGAVALTFVGFGVGSYTAAVDEPFLAKVGDNKIFARDVERQLEGQPANAATRQAVLENLIRQQLLIAAAERNGITPSVEQLRQAIATIPTFQENGKFSQARYAEFIKSRYRSAEDFEADVRRDLMLQTQITPYLNTHFVSSSVLARMGALFGESREVREVLITPAGFAADVKIDDAAVKAYYDSNKTRYLEPESAVIEYVSLSLDEVAATQVVSDAEAQAYFDKHKTEFGSEERRVSHILLTVDAAAKPEAKVAVKAQAEALLQQLKANPAGFAALAKARSQDPGSAEQGGDLGFFGRGAMVKPFEEAAFALQPGQISAVVETEFGFHILKLDEVKAVDFAGQKAAVVEKLKRDKAGASYRAQLEKMGDLAYQQPDSLQGLAEQLKLTVKTGPAMSRSGIAGDAVLGNAKVLEAVYGDDVLKKKHNSEPVELSASNAVVLRVKQYQPQRQKPLTEVQAQVRAELTAREAANRAEKRGLQLVADFKAGKGLDGQSWGALRKVSRRAANGMAVPELRAVFAANVGKLPAFAGARRDNGDYVIYRIDSVDKAPTASAPELAQLKGVLGEMSANTVLISYLDELRNRDKVMISQQPADQ
ncbi:SurA N-terminal domain-containing protein [Vogesella indigofera]|uniref:SurA N-terminal domain-containing protein n=1 Tax=Vogesella indigofera TaxID=45465 RepID=UPI00234F686A|nr:SurA N-terminal domain-containing protein [Vogesella indigofera]MDC7697989.1 SurA N-terminal domain-containing protein [Vogesella indigofera]